MKASPVNALSPFALGAIWLLLLVPSLRPLAKFAPEPLLATSAYAVCLAAGLYVLFNPPKMLGKILDTAWPSCLAIVALALVGALIYPLADALKLQGGGTDADDALIIAGSALLRGENPYGLTTYFGSPLAPGPGWALLAAPLAAHGLLGLLVPASLSLLVCCLRSTGHRWQVINQLIFSLLGCLLVWEHAAVGNDHLPWALLLLASVLQLMRASRVPPARLGLMTIGAAIVMLALLATSRIIYLALPLIVAFGLFWRPHSRARAISIFICATTLAVGLHAVFFHLTPGFYGPMVVLGKGPNLIAPWQMLPILLLLAAVGGVMLYRRQNWPPHIHITLAFATPMMILGLLQFTNQTGLNLPRWEGASYLIPALPLMIYTLLTLKPFPAR